MEKHRAGCEAAADVGPRTCDLEFFVARSHSLATPLSVCQCPGTHSRHAARDGILVSTSECAVPAFERHAAPRHRGGMGDASGLLLRSGLSHAGVQAY